MKGGGISQKENPDFGKTPVALHQGTVFKWRMHSRRPVDDDNHKSGTKTSLKRCQLRTIQGRINGGSPKTEYPKNGQCQHPIGRASRTVISELSFVNFAELAKPYTKENCVQYLTHIRDSFYPTEICTRQDTIDRSLWLFLFNDPLYFHAVQFAVLAYKEMLLGLPRSNDTYRHGVKTFRLLRQRLNSTDQLVALSDPTALAIITLAHLAEAVGDIAGFETHAQGLQALVKARGGLRSLKSELRELRTKICRVDSALAFLADRPPMFFQDSISWDRYLTDQEEPVNTGPISILIQKIPSLDPRLLNVWLDMRQFAFMCNRNQKSNTRLDQNIYSKITVSMQYRLLHLSFPELPLNDALRLGLLVVMSKLMFGWHPNNKAQLRALMRFEAALLQLRDGADDVPLPLLFWVIMLRFQFVVSETDPWITYWLTDIIKGLSVSSWDEARKFLLSMVWFEYFGDSEAKVAFEAICLST